MSHRENVDSLVFSSTDDKIVVSTAAETSALGTGIGTKVLMANSVKKGQRIRIHGEGVYSIPALVPSSITIRVKLGTTLLGTVTTSSLITGATNKAFTFDALVVFRQVGTNGQVVIGGTANYTTASGTKAFDDIDNTGNPVTIDTTVD